MTEQKIADEVAESEFERFADAMDLDVHPKGIDAEDQKSLDDLRRKIVGAIGRGSLVIDEKGQPVFSPQLGDREPITFYEPSGATLTSMDQRKKGQDIAKMMVTLAAQTKQPVTRFSNMAGRDIKICQALITLFLA